MIDCASFKKARLTKAPSVPMFFVRRSSPRYARQIVPWAGAAVIQCVLRRGPKR